MSFEADLNAHLQADEDISALVLLRIWPNVRAENNKTLPCIVTSVVSQDPATDLDGLDGSLLNYRVQVDVMAADYDAARTLAELVRVRMQTSASSFNSRPVAGAGDLYESETRIHRVLMDFSCWYDVP